jgi:glutamate/tyrosine decarboxylase-like PLP-dependent enzyme
MGASGESYTKALDAASAYARSWLDSLPDRPVPPGMAADPLRAAADDRLGDEATDPEVVVDELAALAEPGLMAVGSGRFYGWVMGGALPAALAADWMVSAWDQNAGMRYATPGVAVAEEIAGAWLLDVLGLPPASSVGFTTGATMANFAGLAAGRHAVLAAVGWDVERHGLVGAPAVRVLAGAQRHASVDLALRYLGLGAPTTVAADEQGRLLIEPLAEALAAGSGPAIVCLQAGNLHSGAFDPFADVVDMAHEYGAWVHVDGAFGLWAGASPALRHLVAGYQRADSWATDAHKTLNVPYDCGIAIVADRATLHNTLGVHTSYLIGDTVGIGDPFEKVPEMSRRARGVPVWAALRSLGRHGVAGLVDGLVHHARQLAAGIGAIDGAEILNDVVYTQVCVSFGDDERTRCVTAQLIEDGTVWMSGSRWRDRDVLRISVSNWSTDVADVRTSIEAVRRAAAEVAAGVRRMRDEAAGDEPAHDHELEVLEADETVPPRPEEAAADAAEGKHTPPPKGGSVSPFR